MFSEYELGPVCCKYNQRIRGILGVSLRLLISLVAQPVMYIGRDFFQGKAKLMFQLICGWLG